MKVMIHGTDFHPPEQMVSWTGAFRMAAIFSSVACLCPSKADSRAVSISITSGTDLQTAKPRYLGLSGGEKQKEMHTVVEE